MRHGLLNFIAERVSQELSLEVVPDQHPDFLLLLQAANALPATSKQPVTVGIPFPRHTLMNPETLSLLGPEGRRQLQTRSLQHWSDGSVQWLLLDTFLDPRDTDPACWELHKTPAAGNASAGEVLQVVETTTSFEVYTGAATFYLNRTMFPPIARASVGGKDLLDVESNGLRLTDASGRVRSTQIDRVEQEAFGPVRATFRYEGGFCGRFPCRFVARVCFFAGTGLVRIRYTLHNPGRAKHRGGIWDLGDPGSVLFRELSLEFGLQGTMPPVVSWTASPGQPPQTQEGGKLEIYQDSSGGANWDSKNHVNRKGELPCSFRGYRLRTAAGEAVGERASPVVSLRGDAGCLSAAVPEFWQQFPRSIETDGRFLRLGLFPGQHNDLFELQGGEQKTHTIWLHFGPPDETALTALDWVHQPARVRADREWYAASGVLPLPNPKTCSEEEARLDVLFDEVLVGEKSVFTGREIIDEYGWRNFGEIFADHEGEYYDGPRPVISHYNNQYDQVYGGILQYLRTGDSRWFDLFDPLARHVMDIDIYHTRDDKPAYNGGLFWFTDHYKSAETCTHRTYSRKNSPQDSTPYGGGPGSNHLFTTGLLHYYFLTGDDNAREAVVTLADWVVNMDDGRKNILGLLDEGPTGLASATGTPDYHGPGRGGGNSMNALLDGWLITGRRFYLDKAEELLRRCIHPKDDIASRDLLNVEKRWSYTVFLSVLTRYLDLKAEAGEFDFHHAYARSSLLHYATWMLENERPYFDHPEQLEYPTEAWAGQEFRKANVLRLAAAHAADPLRSKLWQRGNELADRAWSDLLRFESRSSARGMALVMVEGLRDTRLRDQPSAHARRPAPDPDFGEPQPFIPQKQRVLSRLRTVRGLGHALIRLANPRNWWNRLPSKEK